jgi:hypothetical protein
MPNFRWQTYHSKQKNVAFLMGNAIISADNTPFPNGKQFISHGQCRFTRWKRFDAQAQWGIL